VRRFSRAAGISPLIGSYQQCKQEELTNKGVKPMTKLLVGALMILSFAAVRPAIAQNAPRRQSDSTKTMHIKSAESSSNPVSSASTASPGVAEGDAMPIGSGSQQERTSQPKQECSGRNRTTDNPSQGDADAPQNYVEYRSGG
jgi:hypothetical protein